jgi:DNA-binding CsgD family transcriptional regulator
LGLHVPSPRARAPFTAKEIGHIRRLSPVVAAGIRAGLLVDAANLASVADAPGLVMVRPDGSLISTTAAGELWLAELGVGVPIEVQALAASVSSADAMPRLRVRTRAGRWAVLHASPLTTPESDAIAIIIEEPSRAELAAVLMMAYGLTRQEQVLTGLICRGRSTSEIVDQLHITANTVQDHLKSIFEKTGVGSRRELVATILQDQYLPRAMAAQRLGPSGFFA